MRDGKDEIQQEKMKKYKKMRMWETEKVRD